MRFYLALMVVAVGLLMVVTVLAVMQAINAPKRGMHYGTSSGNLTAASAVTIEP